MFTGTVVLLTLALAAANGANDVSKGIATLAGAGVARYRRALLWGAGTTFIGALVSAAFADRLAVLFSRGIVAAPPTLPFVLAVLVGATAWVAFATATRLPVSTTHAIVGALIGAGVAMSPATVNWPVVLTNVAGPLVLSVGVAYVVSAALGRLRFGRTECVCLDVADSVPQIIVSGDMAASAPGVTLPMMAWTTGSGAECAAHGTGRVRMTTTAAHWLTSGATGFARGLNDTPKIVAIGAFALVPNGGDPHWLLATVAAAMAFGGVVAGMRVARSLGENVVHMNHVEGFRANLTTALLVGAGANLGLPMSTTHVATGAIAGLAREDSSRLNRQTLRAFGLAWTLTPLCAGLVSMLVTRLLAV
jgi:PiT family inorganic phosphate transporter